MKHDVPLRSSGEPGCLNSPSGVGHILVWTPFSRVTDEARDSETAGPGTCTSTPPYVLKP
jgi:hypothetical protein